MDFYDAELSAHHEHLRAAYGISPGDEVVDIGCGTGLTTREAARAAAPGRVVGVDVSARMLDRARQVTAAEGLENVRYELGDAQVHRFDPAGFDVAISRFGTMFFSDPPGAFANIAAALRPGARLVLLVWQRPTTTNGPARSPPRWATRRSRRNRARTRSRWAMPTRPRASLRPPALTIALRRRARTGPLWSRPRCRARVRAGVSGPRAALATLSDDEAARTVERLRALLAAHYTDERGVVLDSRSWLITAKRRR